MPEGATLRPFRLAALTVSLAGIGLIAEAGARGPRALFGFGLFCFGMAALDGLFRGRFGVRQPAIFLGFMGLGMGVWAFLASSLLELLELPVAAELRPLLIGSASCFAGSAAGALLTRTRIRGRSGVLDRVGRAVRFLGGLIRPGEPRRDPPYAAGQQWQPAGPVREG